MSQADKIWAHLNDVGPITPDEARRLFRCARLAARIEDLRRRHGHDSILTETVKYKDGAGIMVKYARYHRNTTGQGRLFS